MGAKNMQEYADQCVRPSLVVLFGAKAEVAGNDHWLFNYVSVKCKMC